MEPSFWNFKKQHMMELSDTSKKGRYIGSSTWQLNTTERILFYLTHSLMCNGNRSWNNGLSCTTSIEHRDRAKKKKVNQLELRGGGERALRGSSKSTWEWPPKAEILECAFTRSSEKENRRDPSEQNKEHLDGLGLILSDSEDCRVTAIASKLSQPGNPTVSSRRAGAHKD